MVDQLHPLAKPALLLLIMQLVQTSVLSTRHEDAPIVRPNDACHIHITRDRHVCGEELDVLVGLIVRTHDR